MGRTSDNAGVTMDGLEARQHLAVQPTPYEQFALELINRARANPSAEASRLGVGLNEGLAAGTISTAAKQPLAMNYDLTDSARRHLNWLRANGKFQHEGSGGSSPQARMAAAGYSFGSPSGSAENLALSLASTIGDVAGHVETLYQNLFTDRDVAGRGHRLNLLNGSMREAGSGVTTGDYRYNNADWKATLIGQDLAYNPGNAFLTGVAYDDFLKFDDFYSPGEGIAGVTIVAKNKSSGATFSATTNVVGGYQMRLPAGTYTVTGTRVGKARAVTYGGVVVASQNVKRDFVGDQFNNVVTPTFAALSNAGALTVSGTSSNDVITLEIDGDELVVTRGNESLNYALDGIFSIAIDAGAGNDSVNVAAAVGSVTLRGGAGDDTLNGTDNADQIYGGDGDDRVSGNGGNDTVHGDAGDDSINGNSGKNTLYGDDGEDRLNGSSGPDKLYGGAQDDRLYGNAGDDVLDGGSHNDRLYGDDGNDILLGGNGKDRIYGQGGNDDLTGGKDADLIDGGAGKDKLRDRASIDAVLGIE